MLTNFQNWILFNIIFSLCWVITLERCDIFSRSYFKVNETREGKALVSRILGASLVCLAAHVILVLLIGYNELRMDSYKHYYDFDHRAVEGLKKIAIVNSVLFIHNWYIKIREGTVL